MESFDAGAHFQPPETDYAPTDAVYADLVITASLGKRFANHILDWIISQVLLFVAIFVLSLSLSLVNNGEHPIAYAVSEFIARWDFLLTIGFTITYYVFFETLVQRTPAKYLTKTMVLTDDDQKPSLMRVIGRTFARYIPFNALSILFSDEIKGWHDSLSGTKVVVVVNH